jgi:catechol 2,3-dioxygenase-like lactoylglutathione lyase family enzyme
VGVPKRSPVGCSLAHLTLPTRDVQATAVFLEQTLGYRRVRAPENSPIELVWLDIGGGQQFHSFEVSPFEGEFGRHVALFHPGAEFDTLKRRLVEHGATLIDPIRSTPFQRFFFREPINGYVFEIIDRDNFIEE